MTKFDNILAEVEKKIPDVTIEPIADNQIRPLIVQSATLTTGAKSVDILFDRIHAAHVGLLKTNQIFVFDTFHDGIGGAVNCAVNLLR